MMTSPNPAAPQGDAGRLPLGQDTLPVGRDTLGALGATAVSSQLPAGRASARGRGQVGRFVLIEPVGAGGFGEVWRAFDPGLDREVAVKLSYFEKAEDGKLPLPLHEARAAARLRHPAIVPVFDSGVDGETAYIVSEFVPGETLEAKIQAGPLGASEAAALARTLAEALAYAHGCDVIHRDVKPANVLLGPDGQPLLTDFGVARRASVDGTISEAGEALGTPAYMSPEQARGDVKAVGPRSDVYSLGLVLYEMLAGRRAYSGTAAEALRDVLLGPPPPLRAYRGGLPRDLETIVAVATAREPRDRYPTAAAFSEDLGRYLDGLPLKGRRVGIVKGGWRRLRRKPALAVGVGWLSTALAAPFLPWFGSGDPLPPLAPAGAAFAAEAPDPAAIPARSVVVDTEPSGAKVWFFPLDPSSGWIDPRGRIDADGESPVRVELPPGEYQVVAELPGGRFNETTRWVPFPDEEAAFREANLRWEARGGSVHLAPIPIPETVPDSLVPLPGTDAYATADHAWRPSRLLDIPAFQMTATELTAETAASVRTPRGRDAVPAGHAVTLRYDEAVTVLERLGLRMPSEFEWEYATRLDVPDWEAVQAQAAGREDFGPAGGVDADVVGPWPGVRGLRSGRPEWTASWGDPMPWKVGASSIRYTATLVGPVDPRTQRSVRGGDDGVQHGDPAVSPIRRHPGLRYLVNRFDSSRKIGVRGVRSVRPRKEPEDFLRDLGPAD